MSQTGNGITLRYFLCCVFAVAFTWLFHESAHWATGRLLGYEMGMTLNTAFPLGGTFRGQDGIWVSAAGPIATIVQAAMVSAIILLLPENRTSWAVGLFPMVFVCFYMRLLASIIGILIQVNDESRVSLDLGLGKFAVPVVSVGILFLLLGWVWWRLKPKNYFLMNTFLFTMAASSIIIIVDNQFKPRLF